MFRLQAMGQEVCRLEYVTRVIRADDIPVPGWKGHLSMISLLAKGLYQMTTNDKKGPD